MYSVDWKPDIYRTYFRPDVYVRVYMNQKGRFKKRYVFQTITSENLRKLIKKGVAVSTTSYVPDIGYIGDYI